MTVKLVLNRWRALKRMKRKEWHIKQLQEWASGSVSYDSPAMQALCVPGLSHALPLRVQTHAAAVTRASLCGAVCPQSLWRLAAGQTKTQFRVLEDLISSLLARICSLIYDKHMIPERCQAVDVVCVLQVHRCPGKSHGYGSYTSAMTTG